MLWRGCVLRVGVLGINFKTAELSLREAIAKGAQSLAGEKCLFFPHPTVLLSTCNRTEIYFSAEDLAEAQSDLLSLLRQHVDEAFEHRLYSYFGIDCFAHLCRVASGLDSAIVAETEIQRQVRIAYARACEFLSLPGCLHFLFQKTFKIAKSVRNTFTLERGAPTLFTALWQIAEQKLYPIQNKRILLVGYSEIHRGFATYLASKGIKNLTFCTRCPAQVAEAPAFDRAELERWQEYDLISCASQSSKFLIQGCGKKMHLLFDLSVPRNIDPSVEGENVFLFNIEQIGQLIEQKKFLQREYLEKAETHLWENVLRLARLYRDKVENKAISILSNNLI